MLVNPRHQRLLILAASLRTHKPLTYTSMFGSAVCRLWGEFVGSYSSPA